MGARFSAPVQTGPGAHPTSYTVGGSFPRLMRPGRGVDNPSPPRAEVKERIELYLYSPYGPSLAVLGRPLPLPLIKKQTGAEFCVAPPALRLVEALRYKPESCGFDSRWRFWNLSLT